MNSSSKHNYPRGNESASFPLFVMLALLFPLLTGCQARTKFQDAPDILKTRDGLTLAAHRYVPLDENPPGLVLVHRAGGNRSVWEAFAVQAQQAGYLVITMDLRGHGESRKGVDGPLSYRNFSDADWQKISLDIEAALERLRALGANSNDLFLVGEDFGANLALQYTVEHREVQGVVLLSAGASYHGIRAAPLMEQMTTRPSLLVWGERDDYAASCGATLQQRAPGHVEVRIYPGTAHGADIFSTSPGAMGQILVWLDQMRAK